MPFKLESFSRENDVLTRDGDIYCECARGCDVSACAAANKRIGSESARRETDWSPIRAGHARNHPIPNTGRSIGASLPQRTVCETDVLQMLKVLHGTI